MKFISLSILATSAVSALVFASAPAGAFTVPSTRQNVNSVLGNLNNRDVATTLNRTLKPSLSSSALFAASIDADERTDVSGELSPEEEWRLQLDSEEVAEVRQELIQKYLSSGRSMEYAEKEVDKFLSDPKRSAQFLEMRRYAKAQANDLGFEFIFQLGGAFAIGLIANVGVKYYASYKQVYPNHDGPIPFL